ncbi:phosphoribosylformylglycinamidine synthase subunit PurS [Bartonella krasnovii]|uniref:Phosphoribosylformylglycinamidine synthase subunit PurS n=1 Tax=Bartonella krasnovii TaxID=2267275 RepID=A0A5B9D130_9HYPH|nr:phosphoribosylformylglycinamidine synthase subunit PurS [Bartonella krasnovii]QEE12070.1 phosphoribosylformylglycinamidine synthase subunit PurS [Bartonella krasnovii]UNF29913.1 phosphoribosylformylglycinamidine synthase subunit PurS [Bartonella krasnovii]UNF36274.1 phosphoribosylformylglycinamidine synthase subunit PurS [Bartonella krasnovii]UNF37978.1 phosphoribosylformylglycinamidine synthase subunit PurS [Bartonella krasnovii]UNF39695.1 phosphoribosylformylglycinamidine synthase subunit
MKARITVTLKESVLDPQGEAIAGALKSLAFEGIHSIRQGKVFDIVLDDHPSETAKKKLEQMCEELLANTVIENYTIELL